MPTSTYELVTQSATIAAFTQQTVTLTAPTGKKPLAGGWKQPGLPARIVDSYPSGQTWVFRIYNDENFERTFDLYLVTATV